MKYFHRFPSKRRSRRRRHAPRLRLECLEPRRLLTAVCGDFNGDHFDDLAIGVPGEDIGECLDAGAVDAIYGQDPWFGLIPTGSQFWHQDRPGILDDAEQWDCFGQSLP